MTDAHFYVYNVGHGVCTLLTGKKDDGATPYCAVFDCGSKSLSPFCEKATIICDIKQKILHNAQGYPVQIDDVVISHQDIDHWNMLLDLFLNLNSDEYIEYKGSFFGGDGHAWKLTSTGVYEITDETVEEEVNVRQFRKRGYGFNSEYTGTVKYSGDDMLSVDIYMFVRKGLRPGWIELQIKYCTDSLFITSTENEGDGDEPCVSNAHFQVTVPSADALIYEVLLPLYQGSSVIIRGIFYSLAQALSPDALGELVKELNSDTFIPISIPIKRIVMGGGKIERRYALLKDLLFYMTQYYGENNDDFLWLESGSYIAMDGNTMDKIERQFPEYDIEIDGLGPTIIRNLTSAVVQFNITNNNILLLPGDVTQHGFVQISQVASELIPVESLKLFLAPHHGSDRTNFSYERRELADWQPLYSLLDTLLGVETEEESACNLVVSGYNSHDLHPGELFIEIAEDYFSSDDAFEHCYACADEKNSSIDVDEYIDSLVLVPGSTLRIFTTNALPLEDYNSYSYIYFKYFDGDITLEPRGTLTVPNLKRRLPPDDVFI